MLTIHLYLSILSFTLKESNNSLLLTRSKFIRNLPSSFFLCIWQTVNKFLSYGKYGSKLSKLRETRFSDPSLYRSTVGALQFIIISLPELNFSVNEVCQFMAYPLEEHWHEVKRIPRHLKGTQHIGLRLNSASTSFQGLVS